MSIRGVWHGLTSSRRSAAKRMMPSVSTLVFQCACAASLALASGNDGAMVCRHEPEIDSCAPGFDCCDTLNTSVQFRLLYTVLKARTDIDDVLKGKLARCEPVGAAMGLTSVASPPFSVEALHRYTDTASLPSTLFMSLHVLRIFEIDQKAGNYRMQYTLRFRWRDCRLVHSCPPVSLDNQDPDYTSFWRPPIYVVELLGEVTSVEFGSHTISANGTDDYFVSKIGAFYCPFDFTQIPWDVQRCTLTFAFPTQIDHFMHIQWSDAGVTSSPLSSQEWDMQQGSEWARLPVAAAERRLAVQFAITRKSDALTKNFIYPAIFFYTASWSGLWIDREAVPARAMMSLMPVLITVNKYTQLSAMLPLIGYSTRLDQFLFSQVIILVLHVLEFALVHYASRSLKHAEGAKHKEDADELESQGAKAGGLWEGAHRWRLTVCAVVCRHFETHFRWISPALYAFVVAWLCH